MFFTSFFVAGVAILLLNSIRAHSFDIYDKPTTFGELDATFVDLVRMTSPTLGHDCRKGEHRVVWTSGF